MGIEINLMVKQFEALQHGDCWIGNNFKETLYGADAVTAVKTIMPTGNSFWQLTAHLVYWRTTVVNRLTGSSNPPPFKAFLLPEIFSEKNWKQSIDDVEAAYQALGNALHNIKDDKLGKATLNENQTYYQLITGCLQHDAYHLAQMMLLKKAFQQ